VPAEVLEEFKRALTELDDQAVLDRFYYSRPATMLEGDREATLRRAVSSKFGVAMRDVIITGSAKLGFTVVTKERRPIFSPFGDTSDIDVAIISAELFTSLWREALEYVTDHGDWSDATSFRKFLMRGWLRPDRLPKDAEFPRSREWFDYFRGLTGSGLFGPYKISGGVYYDEWFWERYASSSFANCRLAIEAPL
jgi:hypothetical protein